MFKLKKAFQNRLIIFFLIFMLFQVVGVFYSSNIPQGWDRVLSMSPLAFLPIVMTSEPLSKKEYNSILKILKYIILAVFLGLLLYHIVFEGRVPGTFVHFTLVEGLGVSQFYLSFVLAIPLLAAIDDLQNKQGLIANLLIVVFCVGLLLLLKNLTSLLFILILWGFLIIRFFRSTQYLKALSLLFFGVIIFLLSTQLSIIRNRIQFLQKTTDFDIETIITKNQYTYTKNTLEHRLLIDYLAIQTIARSLPFGLGTGDVQDRLNEEYEAVGFKSGIKFHYNAHNQYLEEFLKTGLIGGLFFLALLIYMCSKVNLFEPYYPALLFFFITGCFFESYLNRQHGVFIFGFILPFFLNCRINRN
jgi:O-antigen ligase